MFREKYLKYKLKYLNLKEKMAEKLNLLNMEGGRKKKQKQKRKGGENHKSPIILITRQLNRSIIKKFTNLLDANIETYIMCDDEPEYSNDFNLSETNKKNILNYSDEKMESLGWTNHMSRDIHRITAWDKATYYAFLLDLPYVWIIEDDVYWNDAEYFKNLIEINNDSDLIAYPRINKFSDEPDWMHWNKSKLNEITPNKDLWSASFNQICRLSNRLLKKINELCKIKKRLYFHEVMFPTLCRINNYKITYIPDLKLNMYINIRWDRPFARIQIKQLIIDNKYVLLHPVKDEIL